ncbi:MAG: SDR family oxidoreductase [Pseudomonadota bacterium]|nr:SDR family oxidoreductase [Pseudomonadota bacterium]
MLEGKTALVTGSVIGIGNATARAFAAEGCNIMMCGLGTPEEIETSRAAIETDYGVTVKFHSADLADRRQTEELAKSTQEELGSIDILVNNAVIRYYDNIVDFDPKNWDHALAVNVTAPFDLTRLALPIMREEGWGRIVNISSIMGLSARSGRADYITSKTAIIGLTRSTAAETLRDPNITCNAIAPGSVLSDFIKARIQRMAEERQTSFEDMAKRYKKDIGQIADFIEPAQIADAILYLCRDESRHINGTVLPVDGGVAATWIENPDEI